MLGRTDRRSAWSRTFVIGFISINDDMLKDSVLIRFPKYEGHAQKG